MLPTQIQNVLAPIVIDAVTSTNPTEKINKYIKLYTKSTTVGRMLSYIFGFWKTNIPSAISILKDTRYSEVNPPPNGERKIK